MDRLFIDIESFSDADLTKTGVYKYAESPLFEVLLFGYSMDGGDTKVIDIASGEEIPEDILDALTDDAVLKFAHNASFERVSLSFWLKRRYPDRLAEGYLDPKSWRCTMVWSAYLGLPLSLSQVGSVLKLPEQKLKEGKDLIRYFCNPCRPTLTSSMRERHLPEDDPDRWERFKGYNKRDVEVEAEICRRLSKFPVPDSVWEEYCIDQQINDRGILIDMELARAAIRLSEQSRDLVMTRMKELTGLENPNSVEQLKRWLRQHGMAADSLSKDQIRELIKTAPPETMEVLLLRQKLAKSSVKKYEAMVTAACGDDRARGMFMFYGASRSGRWAGRIIQLQNLVRNSLPDLDVARELVRAGDYDAVDMLYGSVLNVLSELVRTAFIPRDGYRFLVADYSAIEARMLAWLAGEQWRIDAFREGKDIYCASASQMFGVPVEKHGMNGHLRQKGKIAELALGYGGSVGALKAMGALDMGLAEEELKPLVDTWRGANTAITKFWWAVDKAVKTAVRERIRTSVGCLRFEYRSGMLLIHLPSGRHLTYVKPRLEDNDYGSENVTYMGLASAKKWERIESYGPKFVENITQALSRDILANAMRNLSDCRIVAHIHDELIIESDGSLSLEEVCRRMAEPPSWAEGLLLRADGYVTDFYKKD